MHALALHAPLPQLGYRYGRRAHPRTLAAEHPPRHEPTTPVRPLMSAAERTLLALERRLFLDRSSTPRRPVRRPRPA